MKIAYLAPYRDGTGYAIAATNYIKALNRTDDIDLVIRPVKMTERSVDIDDELKALEDKNLYNVDAMIQHNLPNQFMYKSGVLNIGMFHWETSNFVNSRWAKHLLAMDRVWVSCEYQKQSCINSGVLDSKIDVVPCPADSSVYQKDYGKITNNLYANTCLFYNIYHFGKRKNIEDLIASYYTAFSSQDNVALVLKHQFGNKTIEEQQDLMRYFVQTIKKRMRKYADLSGYPKIILIPGYLPNEKIYKLHNTCHVFVTASYGEAWCLPAFDALAIGNRVIVPDHGAFKDFVPFYHRVPVAETNVCIEGESLPEIYCGNEYWAQIDTHILADKMKVAYQDWQKGWLKDKQNNTDIIKQYSYETIGKQMKEIICKIIS